MTVRLPCDDMASARGRNELGRLRTALAQKDAQLESSRRLLGLEQSACEEKLESIATYAAAASERAERAEERAASAEARAAKAEAALALRESRLLAIATQAEAAAQQLTAAGGESAPSECSSTRSSPGAYRACRTPPPAAVEEVQHQDQRDAGVPLAGTPGGETSSEPIAE